MKFTITSFAVLLLALGASAQVASHAPTGAGQAVATQAAPVQLDKAVARVNGAVLTERDLLREEYAIFPYARQHNGTIPKDMEPEIRRGALQMIIFEELVYQEARKKQMTVTTERLDRAAADFRKQFDSAAQYRQFLQQECGGKVQVLRDRIKRSLMIDQYLKLEVEKRSKVSLAEVKAFYDQNGQRFAYPESFAIQTITIMPPANASAAQRREAQQRAQEALKQAKATKSYEEFGVLAEKVSEDDYRVMMGDHKWVARDKMPPEMLQAALAMKDGQVSDLLQVGQYYVIFRLNKHVAAGKTKFEEVKDRLRADMEKNKTQQVRAALNKKLQQGAKVEIL